MLKKVFLVVALIQAASIPAEEPEIPGLSDQEATSLTRALFINLKNQQGRGILFGQQHAVVQGQGFRATLSGISRSDMQSSVNSLPAVHGYNINKLINFSTATTAGEDQIRQLFKLGIVITMHWPADNPATGGDEDDLGGQPVQELVTAGSVANRRWTAWLDRIGDYLNSLAIDGEHIPVILRPLHEMTGGGNWYGAKKCTPQEFIAAWRFTIDYLRVKKNVHNILVAFAPTNITAENYFLRYPGDAWVDVLSFDNYDTGYEDYTAIIVQNAALVVEAAAQRSKIAAIAEAGFKDGIQDSPFDSWYLQRLLAPLTANPVARRVAYILTWTNSSPESYWVPLPGQRNYQSFLRFCQDPMIVLARNIPPLYSLKAN